MEPEDHSGCVAWLNDLWIQRMILFDDSIFDSKIFIFNKYDSQATSNFPFENFLFKYRNNIQVSSDLNLEQLYFKFIYRRNAVLVEKKSNFRNLFCIVPIHLEFEKNELESRFSSKLRSEVTCVITGYDVIKLFM